jgi:hypothetical protein
MMLAESVRESQINEADDLAQYEQHSVTERVRVGIRVL